MIWDNSKTLFTPTPVQQNNFVHPPLKWAWTLLILVIDSFIVQCLKRVHNSERINYRRVNKWTPIQHMMFLIGTMSNILGNTSHSNTCLLKRNWKGMHTHDQRKVCHGLLLTKERNMLLKIKSLRYIHIQSERE